MQDSGRVGDIPAVAAAALAGRGKASGVSRIRTVLISCFVGVALMAGCTGGGEPSHGQNTGDSSVSANSPAPSPAMSPSGIEARGGGLSLHLTAPAKAARNQLDAASCTIQIRNRGTALADIVAVRTGTLWLRILIEDRLGKQLCDLQLPESIDVPTPSLHDVIIVGPDSAVSFFDCQPWPLLSDPPAVGTTVYAYAELMDASAVAGLPHDLSQALAADKIPLWSGPMIVSNKCPILVTRW